MTHNESGAVSGANKTVQVEKHGYCTCGAKISSGTLCVECKKVQDMIEENRKGYALE